MKVLVLIGGGRSAESFQSLLDGHPQIMQFPHHFSFQRILEKGKAF